MFVKKIESLVFALLIGLCAGMVPMGCAVLAAGGGGAVGAGGTYAYIKGELKRTYEVGYERAWTATNDAVKKLELEVETTTKDAFFAELKGNMASGEKFSITLEPDKPGMVTVGVRIGLIGDKEKSQRIHEEISSRFQTRTSRSSG
jgi:hypothetical protein